MADAELPETVSVAVMAELLGLTERRVQQLVDREGYGRRRDRNEYLLRDCVQGAIAFWKDRAEGRVVSSELDQEKLLDARLKNRQREIEIAKLQGTVITIEAHKRVMGEAFELVRSNLLNLPGNVADQLLHLREKREVVGVLQPAVDHALLSVVHRADGLERKDHLPDDFPARSKLEDHGVRTWSELLALGELTDVHGIGPATAKRIRAAIKARERA